jgi:hypothetical protein
VTRPTHGWCPSCKEHSAIDPDRNCLWCGGSTEERAKRGGWKRPDKQGSRYTEAQLRALHIFHEREGLSVNELGRRTYRVAGYKTHTSAACAISRDWKRMGLPVRDRIEQVKKTCTVHGLAPKHGPRPGYGTYKRRVVRGDDDQPPCEGVRQHSPRKGDPCGRPSMKGSRFCPQHDPDRAARNREHLKRIHDQLRESNAATALPMAPFAEFVNRCWEDEGSLAGAGERLGLHPTAVSVYRRGLGTDKRPKATIQRATVERALEQHGSLTVDELYAEGAVV